MTKITDIQKKNGKWESIVRKATKTEQKIFDDNAKLTKAGKNIWYTFGSVDLMTKLDIKAKKDKLGNIYVDVKWNK